MQRTFPTEDRIARVLSYAEMKRKNTPLSDLVESFFRANYDLAPKTGRFYRQNLVAFIGFAERTGAVPARLADFTKERVDAFLKWRMERPTHRYPKGSPFATRAACVTLKVFANWLAREDILSDKGGASILRHVRRTKVDDDVRQPLTAEEEDRLLSAATRQGPMTRALVVLGLGAGLRLNEMRQLRVGDLDLERCELTVRAETSKSGRGRTVYLHPAVVRELDRYLRDRPAGRPPEAPLFPTRKGEHFTPDGFGKVFDRLRRRSDIRRFSAHLLRHTWATNYMRHEGSSLLDLQRQGGWRDLRMVARYSHAIPPRDVHALPNPLARMHKDAFRQSPSSAVSRLRVLA